MYVGRLFSQDNPQQPYPLSTIHHNISIHIVHTTRLVSTPFCLHLKSTPSIANEPCTHANSHAITHTYMQKYPASQSQTSWGSTVYIYCSSQLKDIFFFDICRNPNLTMKFICYVLLFPFCKKANLLPSRRMDVMLLSSMRVMRVLCNDFALAPKRFSKIFIQKIFLTLTRFACQF